jgi:hypothetical protein
MKAPPLQKELFVTDETETNDVPSPIFEPERERSLTFRGKEIATADMKT